MITKRNKVIFSDFVNRNHLNFNYIDVGARGDTTSPWLELENRLTVVGFEPDVGEADRLSREFENRKYFGVALWSRRTTRKVYINEWKSTSSMYPPDTESISAFEPQHWTGRRPVSVSDVQCDTLDNLLSRDDIIPDFVKIDTQGAELEILRGGESMLKQHSPLVTCETWCYEVYKGAQLMHEVIAYMDSVGYQVFDMELAASWRHRSKNAKRIASKPKAIGYEILFVKRQESAPTSNLNAHLKHLLLLELYGYRDYAVFLLETKGQLAASEDELLNLLHRNSRNELSVVSKGADLFSRILRKCAKQHRYPALRYYG